jgi:phage terminase large subunit
MKIKKPTKKQIDEIFKRRKKYREDPHGRILFAREAMRLIPDKQQEDALILFQEKGRVALKAAHGVGKTVFLVILIYSQLFAYTNSIVPCTAPTRHQLSDILWTEAARWMHKSPLLQSFFVWTATKIMVRGDYEEIWYAVAVPSKNPDNLAGFHNDNLLYLIDEAPGVNEAAFPVIEGALTKATNKIAMIGNPVRVNGFFHSVFKDPQGWGTSTISENQARWVQRCKV